MEVSLELELKVGLHHLLGILLHHHCAEHLVQVLLAVLFVVQAEGLVDILVNVIVELLESPLLEKVACAEREGRAMAIVPLSLLVILE